jgi:hypothetical protein
MSKQQPKRGARVDVYRLTRFEKRNGKFHGRAIYSQVLHLTKPEANVIVANGFAVWRGHPKRAINLLCSKQALMLFVGMMRFRGRPESTCIDSKTIKYIGPQGYKHVRCFSYSVLADKLMADMPDRDDALGRAYANMEREFGRVA